MEEKNNNLFLFIIVIIIVYFVCICANFLFINNTKININNKLKQQRAHNIIQDNNIKLLEIKLKKNLPFKFKIIAIRPNNIFILSINGQIIPVYTNNKITIIGHIFKNKTDLSNKYINKYQKIANINNKKRNIEILKTIKINKNKTLLYIPKNANGKVIYEFLDPLCPFCDLAKPIIFKLANKYGYTIMGIYMIVHGKPAYDIATRMACNHATYKDYILHKNTKKSALNKGNICKYGKNIVNYDEMLSKKFKIYATPSFIFSNGDEVVGANITKIKYLMQHNK
jgi:thiol-disulfide isomerase/thioredoxin